jgi:hypothetical protein
LAANHALRANVGRCRGAEPCYFEFAAGPLAVFSKRSVFELIEDEGGGGMSSRYPLQLRFRQSLAYTDISKSFVVSSL